MSASRMRSFASFMLTASVGSLLLAHAPASAQCTAAPAPPAFPIGKAGLKGWFRATAFVTRDEAQLASDWGGRYYSIGGQSGGVIDTVESDAVHQPVFACYAVGGRAGIRFSGDDRLTTNTLALPAFADDYTALLAVELELGTLSTGERAYLVSRSKSAGLSSSYLYIDDGRHLVAEHEGSSPVVSSVTLADGIPYVLGISYSTSSGRLRLFVDGVEVADVTGVASQNDASVTLGARRSGSPEPIFADYFRGSIAEVILYDRELDDVTEREPLDAYLAAKYQTLATAELALVQVPGDFAIVPRASLTASSTPLAVSGTIESSGVTGVRLTLQPDGVFDEDTFSPAAIGTPFALEVALPVDSPGLVAERDIEISARVDDEWVPVAHRQKLVAGDVFLISGQSHAVSADYHHEDPVRLIEHREWIRSFGHSWWKQSADALGGGVVAPKPGGFHWGRAVVPTPYDPEDPPTQFAFAGVGTLGMAIAEALFEGTGHPVAILQGGLGGSIIAAHLPESTLATGYALYEALQYRAVAADLAGLARGIIWMQGYQDVYFATPPATYRSEFGDLWDAWHADYGAGIPFGEPPLQVFLVQTPAWSCCGLELTPIQEVQRDVAYADMEFPDTQIMSGAPLEGWDVAIDPCHLSSVDENDGDARIGYFTLGQRVAAQILRDVYASPPSGDLDAPNIESIEALEVSAGTYEVTFSFDRPVTYEADAECGIYFDSSPSLRGTYVGSPAVDAITLETDFEPTLATYRGHAGELTCGAGLPIGVLGCAADGRPWIVSADGIAALCFADVTVASAAPHPRQPRMPLSAPPRMPAPPNR